MSASATRETILIAGGGTGGHVFPGLAVADALKALADVDVVFCGTARGIEARVVPARGYRLEIMAAEPIKGGGPARAVKGAAIAARETAKAVALVRRVRPKVVLSTGGYAAGPVSLAAAVLRVPVALLEPNSSIGFANKVLAPLAARAYVAWPEVGATFRAGRARTYGVPLRAGFTPQPYVATDAARVLVLGGSQGAAPLNERLPHAIARVKERLPNLSVLHQAGRERDVRVREQYASLGVTGVTVTQFVDDVAREIAAADVVVARAGAVTVAELAAVGRAAILVPFPQAADDHQFKNADALAKVGGALCIRQEAADDVRLATELHALFADPAARVAMADASRAHGRPTAAYDIAKDLLALAGIPLRPTNGGGGKHKNGASSGRDTRHAEAN
jgi:UDP-N-acetylglucosamine--N-acetylmuramyl-(pentapeptide) pyrophosphoryl-undecaprenol N-acetylglucosamine transferase